MADTYFFNISDGGPTDADTVWTDDASAFDGSTTTFAFTTSVGTVSSNFLLGEGTDAPTSGGTITQVRARLYASGNVGTPGFGSYTTLTAPTGGWDWTKVDALEVKNYFDESDGFLTTHGAVYTNSLAELLGIANKSISGASTSARIYRTEIEVTSIGAGGRTAISTGRVVVTSRDVASGRVAADSRVSVF